MSFGMWVILDILSNIIKILEDNFFTVYSSRRLVVQILLRVYRHCLLNDDRSCFDRVVGRNVSEIHDTNG